MNKVDYELGETVWIFMSNHKGNKTDGKIIHMFDHEGQTIYIIEIDTPVDPVYEARTWFSMSKTKDGPIGLWSLLKK